MLYFVSGIILGRDDFNFALDFSAQNRYSGLGILTIR